MGYGGEFRIGKSGSIVLVALVAAIACLVWIVYVLASGTRLDATFFLDVIRSLGIGVVWIFVVTVYGLSMHRTVIP